MPKHRGSTQLVTDGLPFEANHDGWTGLPEVRSGRDEPRGPKRKKEKPRGVKIQSDSSAEPGTGGRGIQTFGSTAQGPCATAKGGGGGLAVAFLRGFGEGREAGRGPKARPNLLSSPSPREITGGVRGGGSPPGMSREAPKGKRKNQGRSRYSEIAQPSPEPGGAYRPSGVLPKAPAQQRGGGA